MEEETRRKAVERYLGGESPKSIYDDLKRTKQWFFKWLRSYRRVTLIGISPSRGPRVTGPLR
jgi:hypothetical protein